METARLPTWTYGSACCDSDAEDTRASMLSTLRRQKTCHQRCCRPAHAYVRANMYYAGVELIITLPTWQHPCSAAAHAWLTPPLDVRQMPVATYHTSNYTMKCKPPLHFIARFSLKLPPVQSRWTCAQPRNRGIAAGPATVWSRMHCSREGTTQPGPRINVTERRPKGCIGHLGRERAEIALRQRVQLAAREQQVQHVHLGSNSIIASCVLCCIIYRIHTHSAMQDMVSGPDADGLTSSAGKHADAADIAVRTCACVHARSLPNLRRKIAAGAKAGAEEAVTGGVQAQQCGCAGFAVCHHRRKRVEGLARHADAVRHAHSGRPVLMQQPACVYTAAPYEVIRRSECFLLRTGDVGPMWRGKTCSYTLLPMQTVHLRGFQTRSQACAHYERGPCMMQEERTG